MRSNANKKTDLGNGRPIIGRGAYNLNFIDWNNEWERVSEVETIIENGGTVEDKAEEQRVRNYMQKEKEKFGVDKAAFPIVKPDLKKECYICLKFFNKSSKVRRLPCNHEFCDSCIGPWIKTNFVCPTCKTQLKKDPNEEEGNISR